MRRVSLTIIRTAMGIAGMALLVSLAHADDVQSGLPELPAELATLRTALLKYQDPIVAVRDGYFSTVGCISKPSGGMGIHFLNPQLITPVPDPMRPPILLYESVGDELRLTGAEWFVPLATGIKERPQLFGRPFDGPMDGHEPLMPAELRHYDLHVWLFKPNPAGLFNSVNPDVVCPDTYSYQEEELPAAALRD